MLRVAHYWDLLTPFHYLLILGFVFVLGFLVKLLIRAKKKVAIAGYMVLILAFLFFALIVRQAIFPGGALHDPLYNSVKFELRHLQDDLWKYNKDCGQFPTTDQGLGVIFNKQSDDRCKDKIAERTRYPEIKYVSDGKTYEMETIRTYSKSGIVIRATSEEDARLYIRE